MYPPTGYSEFTKTIHHDTYPEIDPVTKSDLTGRTVFITGASKGVGRATAVAYAKAGASQIALGARSALDAVEEEIRAAAKSAGKPEPQILSLKLDVQDWSTVEACAKAIEKDFGRLDILLNNAGYLETFIPIAESNMDDYWKTWEINYRGVYWVTKAFLPLIMKTEGGLKTVVNVGSIGGHKIMNGASAYQTTKFAIMRFTEFINAEYEKEGVLAYSAHPGGIFTELASNMPKETHDISKLPLSREGE